MSGHRTAAPSVAGRSTVYAPRAVVASSHPLASDAGLRVLGSGGNAIDAAVAAAAVLSVVEPHMTGIGGDVFALLWSAEEGRLIGLDASGRSGSLMTPEAIVASGLDDVPQAGPGAVTVPGALSGWQALLDRFGSRPLDELLRLAIEIAEEGFPVSAIIARQWSKAADILARDPGARATFLIEGERPPRAGEWFRNTDLARSLRLVAGEGPGALYGGDLGRRVVEGLGEQGGFLTLEDLTAHTVRWVQPLSVDFRGHTIWELPPAGQGIAALQMLGILEDVDLAAMGHNRAAYLHHVIEAKKLAFADLARYVADADTMDVDPNALLEPDYLSGRRALIDPDGAADRVDPGAPHTAGETVYLATADERGNMVSLINSIYGHFGSGVVIPGMGFALQNRGAGFTLEEGHPNRVKPRKRPLHTIIPGFVTRGGEPVMAFGVMGGPMQPQGHTQLLVNLLVFGMDVQEAIDASRFRHLEGRRVALEPVGGDVVERLRAMGHDVQLGSTTFGGAQAILRLEHGWAAGSDPRKDGLAIGH